VTQKINYLDNFNRIIASRSSISITRLLHFPEDIKSVVDLLPNEAVTFNFTTWLNVRIWGTDPSLDEEGFVKYLKSKVPSGKITSIFHLISEILLIYYSQMLN